LRRALQRKFAVLNSTRKAGRHLPYGILAIDADQIGKGGEQRRIGQAFRLNAVMQRLLPSVQDIAQRGLLLTVVFR